MVALILYGKYWLILILIDLMQGSDGKRYCKLQNHGWYNESLSLKRSLWSVTRTDVL